MLFFYSISDSEEKIKSFRIFFTVYLYLINMLLFQKKKHTQMDALFQLYLYCVMVLFLTHSPVDDFQYLLLLLGRYPDAFKRLTGSAVGAYHRFVVHP